MPMLFSPTIGTAVAARYAESFGSLAMFRRDAPLVGRGTIMGVDILEKVLEHSARPWADANVPFDRGESWPYTSYGPIRCASA